MAFVYVPDDLICEPGATSLALRFLVDVQRRDVGGAPAGQWTAPLATRGLAERLRVNEDSLYRAMKWLLARDYIERRPGAGRRQPQYRVRPPLPVAERRAV